MEGEQWAADATGDVLAATWMLSRSHKTYTHPKRGERKVATVGDAAAEGTPRKFLRVHVLGQKGSRLLSGLWVAAPYGHGRTDGHMLRQCHLLRKADPKKGSLFAAVYEPYSGEPTIESVRLEGDSADARGFAALHINLVGGGRDLCFADDSAATKRTLEDGVTVQARFAHVARDADGLKRVSLVGGRELALPECTIRPSRAEWSGRVTAVDYATRMAQIDAALPDRALDGAFFEVGAERATWPLGTWTSSQAVDVTPNAKGSAVTWRKDASVYAGTIVRVPAAPDEKAEKGTAVSLLMNIGAKLKDGERHNLTLVNKATGRRARCNAMGERIDVLGEDVSRDDFVPGQRVTVYASGEGSLWRRPSTLSIERVKPGLYRLRADAGFTAVLCGKASVSKDGNTWRALPTGEVGTSVLAVRDTALGDGLFHLRWTAPATKP